MTPRTNYCGLIDHTYLDQQVIVKGWVNRRRDLGGLIFFDLRDREGLLQIVVAPDNQFFATALLVKHEYVLEVHGIVKARPQANVELRTGQIEVVCTNLIILNSAHNLPILINDETTSETNRMNHRIMDLRGNKMQYNIILRHKITHAIRQFLNTNNFLDIETPFLTLSTPGGARDFLVPSRMNKGKFYALPQSPQLFKQLFMIAGFDRYYQIVRCFRDEELRADRQPEFTQVDIETSFLTEQDIRNMSEDLITQVFHNVLAVKLDKFPVMTYHDALYYYGCDKPDLRIPLKFIDLTAIFKQSNFKIFQQRATVSDSRIAAITLPASVKLSRKNLDELNKFVAPYGASGLSYIKIIDSNKLDQEGLQSPLVKVLSTNELASILQLTNSKDNETILIIADQTKIVNEALNALRLKLGFEYNLLIKEWAPLWVIDFPMFEYDVATSQYMPAHHAFTAPKDAHIELLNTQPQICLAQAYDLVLNGAEVGGGSIRIHQADIQEKVFQALNLTPQEMQIKFGYLLNNLKLGAPPHGGIAFGLDRLVAIMSRSTSIRDVIALPKTTTGQCLLTNAPNYVSDVQLNELGIQIK